MTRMTRALFCALFLVPAAAQTGSGVAVHENGLVATWYAPAKKAPVIIALGGSECGEKGGQLLASSIAKEGFGALALAYCGADGLPPAVESIPLDYFTKAIDWVEQQPLADKKRIGIYGISIGAETSLLVASRDKRIKAVVVGSPSSVVWQGFDTRHYGDTEPTYTFDNKPVPYVPYDMSKPFTSIFDLYQRSLVTAPDHQDAIIPAENINGPVLLISGKADTLWPSTMMADQVIARLDAKKFRFPHEHVAYDNAGHVAPVPPQDHLTLAMLNSLGGSEEGNMTARAEAWKRTVAFFKKYLGEPR